ncbi:Uu.00g099820.m01.CDS01 [Anthostomella pinea]|uniref:Uu.00g099820.m01.CDS01 n=1 Tax=Anthostomella pinea TaxID=933095 RepID=A0AAI8VCZ0_9PEZI|nr:Uu.00g099820.m01.CDS01 [Anthostomella pinea]
MKADQCELYATKLLGERVTAYSEAHSMALPQFLRDYNAKILHEQPTTSNYMISTFQSQALVWLARLMGAKRVLEIGVFVGYSTMAWSHAVGPEGTVTGFEFNADYAKQAEAAFEQNGVKKCELIVGDAVKQLPSFKPAEPYDLIFIDAQKSGYPAYLKTILANSQPGSQNRLLRAGGLIIADNALRWGLVADASEANPRRTMESSGTSEYWKSDDIKCLREYNESVHASERLEEFLCPLWDGVNLARLLD